MDKTRIDDKVAVVTGAGRGLGRAIALCLAEAGASVALLARTAEEIGGVARQIEGLGRKAIALPVDVTDEAGVEEAAGVVMEEFGRVDVLVNNAGVAPVAPLLDMATEDLRRVLDVNVMGVLHCCRAFGAHMVAARSGRVINVASIVGMKGAPRMAAYAASKAAVIGLTRALAVEWARHGVTVNAIAPGYFATDLNAAARSDPEAAGKLVKGIPLRRFGEAEEIGPLALMLASDAGAFITGAVMVIDGGQSAA